MSLCLKHKISIIVTIQLLPTVSALACGPFFPNRILAGEGKDILSAPIVRFQEEIENIKPPVPSRFKAVLPSSKGNETIYYSYADQLSQQTAEVDVEDIKKALSATNLPLNHREDTIERYRTARKVLLEYSMAFSKWENEAEWRRMRSQDEISPPKFEPPVIPEQLPSEFAEYLRGAIFYHHQNFEKARKVWLDLLKYPKQQRLYRSTWAAFMIGKTLLKENPTDSVEWFQLVRKLVEEGFVDSLGLASSSLGWEARAELNIEHYDKAIELYLAQMATGDRTARQSLSVTAQRAFEADQQMLMKLAGNTTTRRVMMAHLLSSSWPGVSKWLSVLEAANIRIVEQADRLAWAAYRIGEMETAQRWLNVASSDSILARWIQSKLLIRNGKIQQAAEQLSHVASSFPVADQPDNVLERPNHLEKRIRGELGVLYVARGQYAQAMDVLLKGGYWEDAAYVAERVLTADELKDYVDRSWRQAESVEDSEESNDANDRENSSWIPRKMRYLLARRLARIGRWKEARLYYPAKWQTRFDEYIQAIRDGHNNRLSKQKQAEALWKAACIARYEGMELLGTEIEPDWFVYGGDLEREPAANMRSLPGNATPLASTADEQRRLRENSVPQKRFHYRYEAANHAWQAAELMPDQSDQTARVLCIAGSWLKDRDQQAADRFYKSLVRRCGKTQLGREADRLRWFPKIEIDKDELLQQTQ